MEIKNIGQYIRTETESEEDARTRMFEKIEKAAQNTNPAIAFREMQNARGVRLRSYLIILNRWKVPYWEEKSPVQKI